MSRQDLIINLTVTIGYIVAGQIGLLIAIPPSNATAVWPASGIALAATVMYGRRVVPGILIGGLLIQTVSILDVTSSDRIMHSILIGSVIAVGGALQAWIGARLVKPVISTDPGLLRERSIFLFYLLAGPVSCLTSASIGMLALWLGDIITLQDMALSWSTWWIGDSIGVFIFAPAVLCLFDRPRDLWKPRINSVAVPLAILTLIAFVTIDFFNHQEILHIRNEFEKSALRFSHDLKNKIDIHTEATLELKEFYENSGEVTPVEFNNYSEPKVKRHPNIQALEWIQVITHEQRDEIEKQLGQPIIVPDEAGNIVPAPARDIYFVVRRITPIEGNENAYGFDIRSNPLARRAAETACKTGRLTVTEGLQLIQEAQRRIGVVFYAPVYEQGIKQPAGNGNPCRNITGLTASVFRLESEILDIHQLYSELSLQISSSDTGFTLYNNHPLQTGEQTMPSPFRFELASPIKVADQVWQLTFTPATGLINNYSTWTIWLIITGGLLVCGLAGMGLLLLTGREMLTEEEVRRRTRDLHREVRERRHIASLLAIEKESLQLVAHDSPIEEILSVVCRGLEKMMKNTFTTLHLIDSASGRLKLQPVSDIPDDLAAALTGRETIAGIDANQEKADRQVEYIDLENGENRQHCSEEIRKYRLKSCWSVPIAVADSRVMGTLALYFTDHRKPGQKNADTITRMTHLIAIAILRKQTEEQLSYQASHDDLTGLVNRREFERRIERLLITTKRDGGEHALCFIDLDQFKVVNDTCGHTAGDELLRQLAAIIDQKVRKRDTLARLGGDEFAVLMEHCTPGDARRLAHTLQSTIRDYQFIWGSHTFRIGVSIGLVAITDATSGITELLKQADAACYMAKDLGRNRIHVYHDEDESLAKRHGEMQWVTRIQKALAENRFSLFAQSIESLQGKSVGHYELLLRMKDEDGTLIPPGAFLPAAERYNLIGAVDKWVIETTLQILQSHPAFLSDMNVIAINLSGESLADEQFLDYISKKMKHSGIDGRKFCFEITETATISNLNQAKLFISGLRELGCRFALDDFGSGLSSFGYLKNLNVDYLKIDGMFVRDIVDDPIDHAMVRSINEIGQVMGMQTIAEFVETDEIKGMLREIGVDYAQGYGIHRPQALLEIIEQYQG